MRGALVGFIGRQQALEARDQALRTQSLSLSFLSQQSTARGDTEAAALLALEALPTSTSEGERPFIPEAEAALYQALLAHQLTRVLKHDAAVTVAKFNRSGDRIVTASYDHMARVWDASNGAELIALKGHKDVVERAEFSADGKQIVTAANDRSARIWDAVSGKQLSVLQPVGSYPTAIFSPDGDRVLTAGYGSAAALWDAQTGRKVLSVDTRGSYATFSPNGSSFATSKGGPNGYSQFIVSIWSAEDGRQKQALPIRTLPSAIAFSPDGTRMLATGSGPISFGNLSRLFDVPKGAEIATLRGQTSDTQLEGVMFSHDGRRIATAAVDGSARLWDGTSGKLLSVLGTETAGLKLSDVATNDHDQEINSAFSQDDRYLATTSLDHMIRIWDVNSASLTTTIRGHAGLVEHVEFSPADNNIVLTASHDGTARLWDIDGVLTTTLAHEHPPAFAVFSPDNVHMVTGGGDTALHLWDAVNGREVARLDTPTIVRSAAFSPDGSRIAGASLEGQIVVWDVASKKRLAELSSGAGVLQVQFSPDGALLSTGLMRDAAQLWDAATGVQRALTNTSAALPGIVFSRDGTTLLAATSDNAAHLLKADGAELQALIGHKKPISAAAFSPDGQLVATASLDQTARIWSVKDGRTVATLNGHGSELTAVSFSEHGHSLLTASRDATVRIWGIPEGIEKVVLRGHRGDVSSAQFSPNGAYVVTASSEDRTVRLWEAQSGRQIAVLASQQGKVIKPGLTRASFSADGKRIAIVSGENSVRIVRAFPTLGEIIVYAKQAVTRQLTPCERRRFFLPVEGDVSDCAG